MNYFFVVFFFILINNSTDGSQDLLRKSVQALWKGLGYMDLSLLNVDAVFIIREIQGELESFVKNEPHVFSDPILREVSELSKYAAKIANDHTIMGSAMFVDPLYFMAVGRIMEQGKQYIWYPSRNVNVSYIENPTPCKELNWSRSDDCYVKVVGKVEGKAHECDVTPTCVQFKSEPRMQQYILTHQALYWKLVSQHCPDVPIPKGIEDRLCANMYRDLLRLKELDFPASRRDLAYELINFCGTWGFRDVYFPELLPRILEWQDDSGCFKNTKQNGACISNLEMVKIRVKRRENELNDGCLMHEGSLALWTLTIYIRFLAETESAFLNIM